MSQLLGKYRALSSYSTSTQSVGNMVVSGAGDLLLSVNECDFGCFFSGTGAVATVIPLFYVMCLLYSVWACMFARLYTLYI